FKDERAEAAFWATHDSTDYWDEFQDVEEALELGPDLVGSIDRTARRKQLISIRLEAWAGSPRSSRRRTARHSLSRGHPQLGEPRDPRHPGRLLGPRQRTAAAGSGN